MTEQGGRDPVILPTDPPEPLPEGYPSDPVDMAKRAESATTITPEEEEQRVRTGGFSGQTAEGRYFQIPPGGQAVLAYRASKKSTANCTAHSTAHSAAHSAADSTAHRTAHSTAQRATHAHTS